MAYDPNATYEPPRRAYYAQNQQQAPIRSNNGYQQHDAYGGYTNQQQQAYYDDYTQGHDGSYADANYAQEDGYDTSYNQFSGNSQRMPQQQPYDDSGYGHGGYQNQANMRNAHPPQDSRRQHDPRYQQRPDRGAQRPPRHQDSGYAPDNRARGGQPRPDPRNGRQYADNQRAQWSDGRNPPPQRTNNDPRYAKQGQSTMEQWKAKEREKMHADIASPQTKQFDSAFPMFPTATSKPDESRPRTGDRSATETPTTRSAGGSNNRPLTSGGRQTRGTGNDRVDVQINGNSRSNNGFANGQHNRDAHPARQEQSGDSYDHQYAQNASQYEDQYNQSYDSNPATYNGYEQENHPDQSFNQQRSPKRSRAPPVPRIDTSHLDRQPTPAYMGQPTYGAVTAPGRPSTAQGARGDYSATRAAYSANTPTYGFTQDYGQSPVRPPVSGPPMTRDDEIEAEMPDFDSAAPAQTSLMQKRSQNAAAGQANDAPIAGNTSQQQYSGAHGGHSGEADEVADIYGDYGATDYAQEYGGQTGPYDASSASSSVQPQQDYRQNPQQRGNTPFQPPINAGGPPENARQLPYRQSPQQQLGHQQNGPNGMGRPGPRGAPGPGRGGPMYPPQQGRPPMNGGPMGPPRMQYGQERVGSAPPIQPGGRRPPGAGDRFPHGYQVPPSSAPPDQQTFDVGPSGPGRSNSNPDALPAHPMPFRPGLMEPERSQSARPAPVRNSQEGQHNRQNPQQPRPDKPLEPITAAELERLRAAVDANPNSLSQALLFSKRLVEAATVLVPADPRAAAKYREKCFMEAYKRLKRLVAGGYPDAQFFLADCYGSGAIGLDPDDKEAFSLYQAAAKSGHAEAAYRTAVCCEIGPEDGGGTRRDYPKALQWYRRAAALGDAAGMYKLGIILLRGLLGQPRNIGEAVSWLKRAADRADASHPHALFELAQLHEPGNADPEVRNKVIPDEAHARDLFERAAQLGHKGAQFRLGQAHEYGGLGLPLDHRASIGWYSKSAAQGDHQAELALAGWYLTGAEGILEHSDTEAYLWARKAASSEPPLAKAMYAMGYFTEMGIGCPASLDEAKRWYGRAASYKFPKAQERLEELRKNPPQKNNRGKPPPPANGRLTRKDQKRDEAECVMM